MATWRSLYLKLRIIFSGSRSKIDLVYPLERKTSTPTLEVSDLRVSQIYPWVQIWTLLQLYFSATLDVASWSNFFEINTLIVVILTICFSTSCRLWMRLLVQVSWLTPCRQIDMHFLCKLDVIDNNETAFISNHVIFLKGFDQKNDNARRSLGPPALSATR